MTARQGLEILQGTVDPRAGVQMCVGIGTGTVLALEILKNVNRGVAAEVAAQVCGVKGSQRT